MRDDKHTIFRCEVTVVTVTQVDKRQPGQMDVRFGGGDSFNVKYFYEFIIFESHEAIILDMGYVQKISYKLAVLEKFNHPCVVSMFNTCIFKRVQ